MTDDERERHIAGAFAGLRDGIEVPPIDPAREQALLAAFDAYHAPHASPAPWHAGRWLLAAAASIAMIAALGWPDRVTPPSGGGSPTRIVADGGGEFVAWPGADALPPFESGELMQVNLPVSALSALGLALPPPPATIVPAEILVGQDGLARAVRVLPE